jgi:hypothetical protein
VEKNVSQVTLEEIEQTLCMISEIKAARIVASSYGAIQEIHVLALPSKSPKQLVRDIESTIMASFGIEIDHKKISIAQLGEEIIDDKPKAAQPRARIDYIHTRADGVNAHVAVNLEFGDQSHEGMAEGPASRSGRSRLVANATLDAVRKYLGSDLGFALEDVSVIQLGHERVAVSCVVVVTPLGEQAFAGSALVKANENDSIVRATLDAINRRLGFLTTT